MKRKLVIIMISVTILLLTIGLTYSYFRAMIIGEGTPISAQAKGVRVIFTDKEEISDPDIIPGWKQTKRFSVKNEGTDDFEYNIVLKDLVNTFITEGFLQYKITSTNGYNMTEYVDIPKSEEAKDVILAYSVLIDPNTTQEYTLELVYHDSETVDQSEDIGSILSGKLGLTEEGLNPKALANIIKTSYPPKPGRTDFSVIDNGTPGLYTDEDDQGTTYYFSGDGTNMNNWVSFAGKLWRIIRINGNGSVRLLYAGSGGEDGYIGSSQAYNRSYNHPGYVGWKYSIGSSLDAIRGNVSKSNAYTTVENWYNALSSTDKSYIDTEAIYCNDRELAPGSSFGTSSTFYYASKGRLDTDRVMPTFKCRVISDRFNEFGLMTADEVTYAGGLAGKTSPKSYYYLNASGESSTGSNNWWTMSPYCFNGSVNAGIFVVYGSSNFGYLGYTYVSVNSYVVRPVISLKKEVVVTGGDGSANSPYEILL